MSKRFFTEASDLQESDLETDSEDESKGCSQKYQLRGNYVKKFKRKTVVSKVEDDATVAATEDDDDATVAATEDDDDATVAAMEDDDDATVVAMEDDDDAADAVARVHDPKSMMEKSENWLKWLRGHYTHNEQWP
jgi:hypothetical protein